MIEKHTVLDVQGMTCPSCTRHVNSALADLDGVTKIDVRLRDGQVVVEHDSETIPVDRLIEALDRAGYNASSASA